MIDGVCCACTIVCIFKANNLVGDGMDRLAVMATFVRVVETGSFTAAARHQNMSQPSVSKSVARLEEALGVRLLMRSTRGLAPTEAGRNFCERARRVVEQADEAIQAARSVGSGLQGRLRVSVGTALGKLHLMPLLPVFLAEHPYLSIDLVLEDRSIDLIEEGIDIGFCLSPLRELLAYGTQSRQQQANGIGRTRLLRARWRSHDAKPTRRAHGRNLHPGWRGQRHLEFPAGHVPNLSQRLRAAGSAQVKV